MNVYLLRHLPTAWNQKGILQGSVDNAILEPGPTSSDQISTQSKVLRELPFDRVLCSQYLRTIQTAERYGFAKAVQEPMLNELHFGPFEGRPKAELTKHFGDKWDRAVLSITLGESMIQFQERLMAFVDRYRAFKYVLAFSHGAVIRGLMALEAHGNIDKMNTFAVRNNELVTLHFPAHP